MGLEVLNRMMRTLDPDLLGDGELDELRDLYTELEDYYDAIAYKEERAIRLALSGQCTRPSPESRTVH